ncbi:AbrB family transcriptional regulator [Novispirillum itersonii]|uniref:AbrB family transcriptional regulator n=1 Tax=Novispirillum itersonii TaxID=189 RepID=UPI00036E6DC7|nr:AbrB family transcriptional regulator [Novispirillum itersonii]
MPLPALPDRRDVIGWGVTVAASLLAAVGFDVLALPAAWVSGPMLATAALALGGVRVVMPQQLRQPVLLLLGVAMGASVTPDVVSQLPRWPWTLLGVILTLPLVMTALMGYYRKLTGADRITAFMASVPGSLGFVLALAIEVKADARQVALVHAVRLFLLVLILPVVVTLGGATATVSPVVAQLSHDPLQIALLLAASLAVGGVLHLCRMPSALMVGGMVGSAVLHGTGISHATLPQPVLSVCLLVLGAMIGTRFAGTTLRQLGQMLPTAVGGTLIAAALATGLAAIVGAMTGFSFGQMVMAYAPGGLEAMVFVAMALGYDPAFVGSHHLARMLFTAFTLPLVVKVMFPELGRPAPEKDGP